MITICLITDENFWLAKYSIENLIQKSYGIEKKIFIIDNASEDVRIVEFGKEVADYHFVLKKKETEGFCYNHLIRQIRTQGNTNGICVFPVGTMVNDLWLSDLMSEHELVERTGIAAIHSNGPKGHLSPFLTIDDTLHHVWSTEGGDLTGIFLFTPYVINGIGGFDPSIDGIGLAQRQFALRVKRAGLNTFYLNSQFATDAMNSQAVNTPENLWNYDKNVEDLIKTKEYKIEL